jgi:hypothetical protein
MTASETVCFVVKNILYVFVGINYGGARYRSGIPGRSSKYRKVYIIGIFYVYGYKNGTGIPVLK